MFVRFGAMVAAAALMTGSAFAADGDTRPRDPREQVPAALLGAWKADVAASKYPGAKPQAQIRTFDYTADGKLLVTFRGQNAQGKQSAGHWAVQIDGTPGLEYTTENGGSPYQVIVFKKLSERTFDLTVTRHNEVTYKGGYELSADGKTLTYTYTHAGQESVVVYHPWDMAK